MYTMNTMNETETKAEALYQLSAAQTSGIKTIVWENDSKMLTFFNNNVITINDFNGITVQFELNNNIYVVRI